jgi:hypothetical protein
MSVPVYSTENLEQIADQFLKEYNPSMLNYPNPSFDPYDVVENFLGVPCDWQYLSQDGTILGMTAFNTGILSVWSDDYLHEKCPTKRILVKSGTILIDSRLADGNHVGCENYTVMHEVSHHLIHEDYFKNLKMQTDIYAFQNRKPKYWPNGHRKFENDLDWIEWQADTCAACILMPRRAVKSIYCDLYNAYKFRFDIKHECDLFLLKELAEQFHVSKTAMWYRLSHLNLVKGSIGAA